jgi:transcriptional regulator GlxA family with amidase domain
MHEPPSHFTGSDARPVSVAILAVPEAGASTIYGMFDLFMSAGRDWGLIVDGHPGPQHFAPEVVARSRQPFAAGNGVLIRPDAALAERSTPDILCIPELLVPPTESIDGRFIDEIDWVKRAYAGGATIATACSGALLLAEGGLLDGYDATTHWAYCNVMKKRYPAVRVHTQRALVIAGHEQRLVMAGGGTSWLDLALYVIARFSDITTAMQVARVNLIDCHTVGQQPFARLAQTRQVEDAVIARCQQWVAEHYDDDTPVARMARLSGLAERSFTRRFRQATGMAPLEYIHTMRLEEAKHLLESSNTPVEVVANEVGYEDTAFFSRLFRRKVGLTPAQYRRRFGALRRAVQAGST